MTSPSRLFASVCLLVATLSTTQAAEVLLDNGDRLTGEVIALDEHALQVETAYAGVITITWDRVTKLTTDQEIVVLTRDERLLHGKMTASPQTGIEIETATGETIRGEEAMVASINPEDWRIGRAAKWIGQANLALRVERGRNQKDEIDLDLDTTLRRKDDRFQLRGSAEYEVSSGIASQNNWNLLGKYDYFVSERMYYSGSVFAEKDEFKGLKYRYRVGPAVGYQFFEGPKRNLKAEAALYYTVSDIESVGRSDGTGVGWIIDSDYHFDNSPIKAYHWQNMTLTNPENMNLRSRTGLQMPLIANILGSAEIEANWDAETGNDADPGEFIYRLKLGYGW